MTTLLRPPVNLGVLNALRWMKPVAFSPLHIISSKERLLPRLLHSCPVSRGSYKTGSFPVCSRGNSQSVKQELCSPSKALVLQAKSSPQCCRAAPLKGGLHLSRLIKELLFFPHSARMRCYALSFNSILWTGTCGVTSFTWANTSLSGCLALKYICTVHNGSILEGLSIVSKHTHPWGLSHALRVNAVLKQFKIPLILLTSPSSLIWKVLQALWPVDPTTEGVLHRTSRCFTLVRNPGALVPVVSLWAN